MHKSRLPYVVKSMTVVRLAQRAAQRERRGEDMTAEVRRARGADGNK